MNFDHVYSLVIGQTSNAFDTSEKVSESAVIDMEGVKSQEIKLIAAVKQATAMEDNGKLLGVM